MNIGFDTSQMLHGAVLTVELAAGGVGVSLVLGALGGLARSRGPRWLRWLIVGYVELVRGLPQILQLFILYFGLTQFGINLSPFTAGFIWMCFYGTGYAIEIFRAGISGVHPGQLEASTALGLSRFQSFRRVVLPQAVARMVPPLTTFVILELKNTTLLYIIGVPEIMYHANLLASNSQPLNIYLIAVGFYLVMNMTLGRLGAYVEHKMSWAKS
ncbi:MAG: amino acid ABC transporter permease [Acidimicrobiaceae bacterium]|nr:amino acid ABC transporter permease [Acidimicrobiaceae bacterium]